MKVKRLVLMTALLLIGAMGCDDDDENLINRGTSLPSLVGCQAVQDGFGPSGAVQLRAEKVVTGLEVPWAIGFLPDGSYLVTERPGRVRLVQNNVLAPQSVLTLYVGEEGEGGLLGLAVDPDFSDNRRFYVYYTATDGNENVNRLARYRLGDAPTTATLEQVLIDQIPAGTFHNGGRIKFGPDGALYVATGDARDPELSQDPGSRAGKILRVNPDSGATENFISGVRNVQGFDWWNNDALVVSDHGPSGELGLTGRDEISIARQGNNLGWPNITSCQETSGQVTPFLSWDEALPPGGLVVYGGALLPSFRDSILVTALGSTHLQRVVLNADGNVTHEMYLTGSSGFGRLRDVVVAPDGALLITTSNCDGRGSCGAEKDVILRVVEE